MSNIYWTLRVTVGSTSLFWRDENSVTIVSSLNLRFWFYISNKVLSLFVLYATFWSLWKGSHTHTAFHALIAVFKRSKSQTMSSLRHFKCSLDTLCFNHHDFSKYAKPCESTRTYTPVYLWTRWDSAWRQPKCCTQVTWGRHWPQLFECQCGEMGKNTMFIIILSLNMTYSDCDCFCYVCFISSPFLYPLCTFGCDHYYDCIV